MATFNPLYTAMDNLSLKDTQTWEINNSALSGWAGMAYDTTKADSKRLVLASWNIGDGLVGDREPILQYILRCAAPDIFAIQESTWIGNNVAGHIFPADITRDYNNISLPVAGRYLVTLFNRHKLACQRLAIDQNILIPPHIENLIEARILITTCQPIDNACPAFILANVHMQQHQKWADVGVHLLSYLQQLSCNQRMSVVLMGDMNIRVSEIEDSDLPEGWHWLYMEDDRRGTATIDIVMYYNDPTAETEAVPIWLSRGHHIDTTRLQFNEHGAQIEGVPVAQGDDVTLNHPCFTVRLTERRC